MANLTNCRPMPHDASKRSNAIASETLAVWRAVSNSALASGISSDRNLAVSSGGSGIRYSLLDCGLHDACTSEMTITESGLTVWSERVRKYRCEMFSRTAAVSASRIPCGSINDEPVGTAMLLALTVNCRYEVEHMCSYAAACSSSKISRVGLSRLFLTLVLAVGSNSISHGAPAPMYLM